MNIVMDRISNNTVSFVCECGDGYSRLPEQVKSVYTPKLFKTFSYYDEADKGYKLVVGLGEYDKLGKREFIEAGAVAAGAMKALNITDYTVISTKDTKVLPYIVQGVILSDYKFYGYKLDKTDEKEVTVSFKAQNDEDISKVVTKAVNLANSINYAKDLVNIPSNMMYPETLADMVTKQLTPLGLQVEVTDEAGIKELGMGAFLAVANGSVKSPRLIVIRHMKGGDKDVTALVGKGLTMDTGGYSLKPSAGMENMKGDMAGAAAVIGAMQVIALNDVQENIVAIIAACENRIGDNAHVPGDVITAMGNKTVEILNTDAEGRLTLADAVTYAITKEKAATVIDIATLTGAVVAALGFSTAGVVTNSDSLFDTLTKAADVSCEQFWKLPTYKEYGEMLKSDIADLKNIGKPQAGSITGGLFIGEFAKDVEWMHIDIAGTSRVDAPIFKYQAAGATGFGVSTLYHLFDR